MPSPQATAAVHNATSVRHLTIEYHGFRDIGDRREYRLSARLGTQTCEYTVWIANTAFAARQALFQDGPDLCYQKLRRELAATALTDGCSVQVTESDLLEYRTAHLPPQRRGAKTSPAPLPEKRG